jgi:hypothetical protein
MATPVHASDTTPSVDAKHVVMLPLYVALGGLAVADWQTTRVALRPGYREANPLVDPTVGNAAAFLAIKGAAAATSIVLSSRIRARHPKLALASIVAANSISAFAFAHNLSTVTKR